MTLQTKAVLLHANFSIPAGRKVDKDISDKIADDYSVTGGRAQSGNFNKMAIALSYFRPFMATKREVENKIKSIALPYLHDNDKMYILPNVKIMDFAKVWRKATSDWDSSINELRLGKYKEALDEARKRLNDNGGMFRESDYTDVERFIGKFKMEKFMRPIPDVHSMGFLTSLSELEAQGIRKEVESSINESMQASVQSLYNKIRDEMNGLIFILDKASPRIRESRLDGLTHLIRIMGDLNFTGDSRLNDIQRYMKEHLLFVPASLRGNEHAQQKAISHAEVVLKMLGSDEETYKAMEKLYGFGS